MEEKEIPKISVIMPVYNTEKYLKYSIESILNQSFKDFEFIIINDGSTDNSLNIIKEYSTRDNRIKIVDQENSGVSISRNKGIINSIGEYVAFVDADDIWELNKLEIQLKEFEKDVELKICGTLAKIINEDNLEIGHFNYPPITDKEIKLKSIYKNPFITSSLLLKRGILDIEKLFNKNLSLAEDYEFNTKYLYKNKCKNLSEYLVKYRIHNISSSRKSLITKIEMKFSATKIRMLALIRLIKSIF